MRREEAENSDLFHESQPLSLPCPSDPRVSQETPQLMQTTDLREKVIVQNRQLEQIFLCLKMAIIRQKTDFCLQETLSSLQPKPYKIQGKHSIIFPPLFGNMENEKLAMIFPPISTRSDTFFFSIFFSESDSSGAWNGGQTQKEQSLDGRQSAGNREVAKKTEPPPQSVFTTLVFLNMMKILSALSITSSLNRTELLTINATSNHKCAEQ